MKRVRVLVANNPRLMRELVMATVADQPDIEVVGEVLNENELAEVVEQVQPDVLIIAMEEPLELARQIVTLSEAGIYGLFHATAEGSCSWYEFACEIFSAAGLSVRCLIAGPHEFPAKVPRPAFSVLENARLKEAGLNRFRHWREGLHAYLEQTSAAAV